MRTTNKISPQDVNIDVDNRNKVLFTEVVEKSHKYCEECVKNGIYGLYNIVCLCILSLIYLMYIIFNDMFVNINKNNY